MHRGSHHYGVPYDSSYSRRGGYHKNDDMIEIVQQFREFKPYLKKRLAYIRESGRSLELQDEIEDIEFYLEVMKDILADESHGVDQLKSFIDKIHEMIRKNPLTDLPGKRHSLDAEDEFGDNDRPRSPSPETRGSDSAANIPLIPTHGAHRTVDVNFTPRNDRHKHLKTEEAYDEWGRPNFENSFTRRDPYNKDVDMRGGFYNNNPTGAIGRSQRRWSEEGGGDEYVGGARGLGRGMGLGRAAPMPHHRQDLDIRNNRGRGYNDNDYERRSGFYSDRRDSSKERERDLKPDWLTGGPSNGNKFDDWQPKRENRDNCFGNDMERRSREDGWRKSHSETRERDEQMHSAQQHIAKYFERRPSSETRREERTEDYNPMFDRRPRNDRSHDSSNMRHDMNNSHPDYGHSRHGGHGDFHGRGRKDDDRHDMRSRFEGGPPHYQPPTTAPPLMNPMTSIPPPQPPSMAYGVPQPQPHFNNAPGLLGPPPSPFTNVNPPLLPLPVPNAPPMGMGLGMPNVPPQMSPGIGHPMNFQQPPPSPNFPLSEMHPNPPYRMPPPPMRHPTPNHPSEHYTRPPAPSHPSEHYTRPPAPNHTSEQYTRPPATNHPSEHYTRPPAPNHPSEHYTRPPTPNHSSEHYSGVPSSSPNYASPVEPSADQVREITMMKAKQCFGRVVSRSPSGTSTQATAGPPPSNSIPVPPGLSSPNRISLGGDSPNNIPLDPRLNRGRPGNNHTVQSRQQSPPAHPAAPSSRSNSTSSKPADAGNVLRPSSDPRARSRIEQERRKFQESKERIRQQEGSSSNSSSSKSNNNKGSKIQELRKQFEKEGFHRLGRPGPKKPCGSFEDAITPRVDEESDISSTSKSGDKNRSSSSSSGHSKERDTESDRQSRSHTDKTERGEREKSPKKNKSGDKNKSKEKTNNKSAEKAEKKKEKESTKERTSPRKKQGQNDKEKTTEKVSSLSPKASRSSGSTESSEGREKTPDPTKPPSFKIPRKPKPKEPETEKPSNVDDSSSESQEKDVCTSPPASPEPALSQVPDVENRIEIVDEVPASSSANSTAQETSESSDVNPNALEYLKQFLMTSADPDDREFILSNPENLKQFFFKIKSEFIAAKGKQSEESISSQANDDKNPPPEEDVQERGRSREKKRNTKRRSSLEKLHDALKEMRFDTMLPLGPRRCTRGVQEEVVPETVEPESTAAPPEETTEQAKASETLEKKEDESEKTSTVRKRGRPPKESPKGKKASSKATQEEDEEVKDETEEPESLVEVVPEEKPSPAPKRGTKRKLKPVKANPRKRTKKSGPITRAQVAAMKKGKEGSKSKPEEAAEKAEGVTTRNKNKANNVILRRLTRRRVCANDTMVNKGLCKIKLESDFTPSVKSEPSEVDPFLNTSAGGANNELEDQLANIINENLDAILDKQAEDNMDLDVFNTLDADEGAGEVCVKDEMEVSFSNPPSGDISFEGIMSGASPVTPKRSTKAKSSVPPPTPSDKECSEASTTTSTSVENDSSSKTSNNTSALPLESTNVDDAVEADLSASTSESTTGTEISANSVASGSNSTVVTPQVNEDMSVSDSRTEEHAAKSNSPKKSNDTAKILSADEDDSSSLVSTSSSSSVTPVVKTEAHDDLVIKTEHTDASGEPPSIDELRKDAFSNKCDKCNFSGKKIVAHYVNKHYPCNIPQARLMPETFNGLIELNTSESPQLLEIVLDESQTPVWPCLYCDDRYNCIVDFYDHLTSHTGEFRYECSECGTSYPYHKSLVNHVKSHKGVSKNFIKFSFESVIKKVSRELSGFLCNDCFYFQLRFESIIRHIEETGHSSLDVKSVRLIRPSANNSAGSTADNSTADAKVPTLPSELKKEKVFDVGSPKSEIVNAYQCMPKSKSSSPTKQDSANDKESECVFFGTNANYVPPRMPPMDCPISIARVFNESFLENIIRKCALKREEDEERNRKRKRSEEEEDGKQERKTVKLRTTISRRRTKLEWDAESDESLVEEPNNFLLSSDDETNESDWSDHSEDDYGSKKRRKDKYGSPHGRKVEGLQNNEHIIKTKQKRKIESWDKRYFTKHDLVTIRRPGDLYCPTTVIFGYVRAGIPKTATHKLRDQKELDKLSPCNGARILAVKCAPKLKEMICDEKLVHLFKCMSSVCSYTTDVAADFISHLNMNHYTNGMLAREQSCSRFLPVRDIVMMKDSDCCAYCAARYREAKDLVEHIINQHAKSIYSCNKCFYRSYYHRYVTKHFEDEHPGEEMNVLKCHTQVESTSEEATLFQIFVYKCDIENPACDKSKRFVFREDFTEHLKECAPIGHELFPCHLCKSSYPLDRLIEHYKTHNLFKFHCSYCTFGSEVKADLDDHFVALHPNTSGRVFYRVKPSASNPIKPPIFPESLKTEKRKKPPSDKTAAEAKKAAEEGAQMENQVNNENQDASESEDNEKGRVTNLKGRDLYRCVTGTCDFIAEDGDTFKEHVNSCTFVAESRSLSCAHCERKMKTATNLLEHMRVHGEKKHVCCLCNFRCWTSAEITKHIKTVHRVLSHKLLKEEVDPTDPDPDILAYPKEVVTKNLITCETLDNNYYSFAKKAVFSFDNINKLPLNKVFSAPLHCAMCPYATKVRSNMVRHLNIHNQAFHDGKTVVPQAQRINPVPYLSREGLEFDKMMNLAASSHKSEGAAATEDVKKLPQFVKEQFRYVCSVCDHITSDENLLQTHIKVIHSEVNVYKCPHCQKIPETKSNPDNIVPLDKIAFHLRLHGPKLYKCGHCMVAHHQLRLMEKHIPDKHPEKKPIHYLVRDVDPDGIPSARPTTFGLNRRHSTDDTKTEKWRCYLCSSKTIFPSWDETKTHCISVHKMGYQLMCIMCGFVADEVVNMLTHCSTECKDEDTKKKVLVMFSRCESTDGDDSNVAPVWRKSNGPVRHIHGNFTEDSMALIKQYSTQLPPPSEPLPTTSSLSPSRTSTTPPAIKTTIKPPPAITSKARRSIGGTTPTKSSSPVKNSTTTTTTTTPAVAPLQKPEKQEVFKYRCHKCDMYRTKNPGELRIHLFNEFRYKRWMCLVCTTKFTTEKSLKGHIERDHQKVYDKVFYELQPENIEIEGEIDECIEKQNRKREMINSFSIEKNGKLSCKHCKEDGYTYDTFETHILQKHSS